MKVPQFYEDAYIILARPDVWRYNMSHTFPFDIWSGRCVTQHTGHLVFSSRPVTRGQR